MNKKNKSAKKSMKVVQLVILLLMAVAIPVATSLVGNNADNRNMAASGSCTEQCPGADNVIRSCSPPESDGSSEDSTCYQAGIRAVCGGNNWCCPSPGGKWTLDMAKCPSVVGSGLDYKIAFGGVNPNSAQCAVDWPVQFMVLGGGESKIYADIKAPKKTEVDGKLIFSGTLNLAGFNKTSGISFFIKGPKHLRMKYGKNNQTETYDQVGGVISLASVGTSNPSLDFSKFPLLPGDVVSTSSEKQDGFINGIDFSYVKSKSYEHETVANGGYLKGDLDGNCQVNSNDVNLLKISLQEKQEQLY